MDSRRKEHGMDWVRLFLAVSAVFEIAGLIFIAWCSVQVTFTASQVEEATRQIVKIASRNERMTQSILQKVYEVSRPQA